MEGLEYLIVELACQVNEKGTREENDGNENTSMDGNEKMVVHSFAKLFRKEGSERTGAERGVGMDRTRQAHDPGDNKGGRNKTSMR